MIRRKKTNDITGNEQDDIYISAESKANLFNIKCLTFIAGFAIFCLGLNEVGVFNVPRVVMMSAMLLSFSVFITPPVIFLIHDILLKKQPSVCESYRFKIISITFMYLGVALVCIAMSFHAVLLMAIPALMAAQYRYSHKMSIYIFVATILLVPISVYGSFFFGLPDRNFIKNAITDEEALDVSKRLMLGTSKRMIEILLHYVVPRLFGLICIDVLSIGIAKRNAKMLDEQKKLQQIAQEEMERRNNIQSHVIEDLAGIIEMRDVGTGEHVGRTKKYVGMIARELQKYDKYKDLLTDKEIGEIENAAPLHDIGKIAIPDHILLKPGRLTPEEFGIIKKHSQKGGEMIENLFINLGNKDFLDKAYNIATAHHEKWDGSGYPNGLKGEDIPLPARIMAIADVYDALVSKRVYKDPMAPQEAFKIILSGAGTHFDPNIIEILKDKEDEFFKIATTPIRENSMETSENAGSK